MLTLAPLVGAISSGNTCIVKFSNDSPNISALLCELARKYLDPSVIQFIGTSIPNDGDCINKLMDQKFDKIMYTGGTRWASNLLTAAAKNLTPMLLELGGKNPVFVDKSCDIDITAKSILYY